MRAQEFTEGTWLGDLLDKHLFNIPKQDTAPAPKPPQSNTANQATVARLRPQQKLSWPVQGRFNRGFDPRPGGHKGVDIECVVGTPVRSPIAGRVNRVDPVDRSANGKFVTVSNGTQEHMFLHLSRCLAQPGQQVEQGAVVGMSGNTGRSTGPHLHWQVQVNGQPVDPLTQ